MPLVKARETALFGSKAVGLGQAMRDGLPVPPGVALSGAIVEAVAAGSDRAIKQVAKTARPLGGPLAVRSSAVDEDGAEASFAGQHLTLLNVPSADAAGRGAERDLVVGELGLGDHATASASGCSRGPASVSSSSRCSIRRRAGVMFTQEPDHRRRRADDRGQLGAGRGGGGGPGDPGQLSASTGRARCSSGRRGSRRSRSATLPEGGTFEQEVQPELVEQLCLDDGQLAELNGLADRCEQVYGPARDIEWAFADGKLLPAAVPGGDAIGRRDGGGDSDVTGAPVDVDAARAAVRRPEPARGCSRSPACSSSAASPPGRRSCRRAPAGRRST